MIVLCVLLLLLFAALLLPLSIDLSYASHRLSGAFSIGPFSIRLFPRNVPGKRKKAKKAEKQNFTESGHAPDSGRTFDWEQLGFFLKNGLDILQRLRRQVRVTLLKLHCTVGGADPYNTAMLYGYISAAVSAILPALQSSVQLADHDVQIQADFDAPTSSAEARLILTLRLWQIISIAAMALAAFIKLKRQNKHTEERKQENGEFN